MEEKARMDGRRWQRRMKMGRDVGGYVGIESLVCERFVCFGEEKRKLERRGGFCFFSSRFAATRSFSHSP